MAKDTVKKRQNKSLILSKGKTPLLARKFKEGGSAALDWMNSSSQSAAQNTFSDANLGGTVSSIAGGIGGFVNSFNTAATIKDTSGIQANIDELANTDYSGATSWDQLSDMKSSTLMVDSVDGSDFTQSTGQQLGNMGSSALQGAALGAKIGGPWGALAGLVVGAGTSAAGWITGNAKARREAARLNYEAKVADMKADNSFLDTFDDMKYQEMADNMANIVKDGGKIHIKPSKRGTFTAAAKKHGKSVQAFAAQVLANKGNYSSAMVKKAQFARNASKWKHSLGGFLYSEGGNLYSNVPDSQTHGTDFSNGMTLVNKGGTHEQNPFEGVQMGIDPQGIPNLVEEGEVIFNDYVFSNRLHPSEKELEKANLPKRYKGHTFALIAEDMGKESSERPNDPISRRGLEDSMMKLAMVQEAQRARKGKKGTQHLMAYGGRKYDGDGNLFKVPEIMDETIVERLPNGYLMSTEPLNSHQEAANRAIVKSYDDSPFNTDYSLSTGMRYAPAVGSALGVLKSAFTKPDYEHSDSLIEISKSLSNPRVRYNPVNRYLLYRPLDRNWYLNNVRAQSGATRRAILDASAGNSGAAIAGLLAADRASQEAQGDAMMKMAMYNENLRQATEQFNRQTDQMNSQGLMAADQANAGIMQNRDRLRTGLLTQALQMREASDAALEATRSANLTNFFDNLGGIGQDNMAQNWRNRLIDVGYFGAGSDRVIRKNGGRMLTKKNRRRR